MTGIEVNRVVKDSLKTLALYEKIFEVERIEVSGFAVGSNEVVLSIYGLRLHLLDENPDYHLEAPRPGAGQSSWLNVLVEDIEGHHKRAMDAGCTELQALTHMPEMGVSNAIFQDPDGYVWMLHQIHEAMSLEERQKMMEPQFGSAHAQDTDG